MTGGPTVEELDAELRSQAAAFQAALAEEQQGHGEALAALAQTQTDLQAVRDLLGDARRELQWLRRAGIDLNAVMDSRLVSAVRTTARRVRELLGRLQGGSR